MQNTPRFIEGRSVMALGPRDSGQLARISHARAEPDARGAMGGWAPIVDTTMVQRQIKPVKLASGITLISMSTMLLSAPLQGYRYA
jgi:hypothetical protein